MSDNEIKKLKEQIAVLEEKNRKLTETVDEYQKLVSEKDDLIAGVASKRKIKALEREKTLATDTSLPARAIRFIKRELGIGIYG